MTHRYHPDPDVNDPEDAILWDDCEDCARRATGAGLDSSNTRRAIRLMLRVERGVQNGERFHYLTRNERELCTRLSDAWIVFERAGVLKEGGEYL